MDLDSRGPFWSLVVRCYVGPSMRRAFRAAYRRIARKLKRSASLGADVARTARKERPSATLSRLAEKLSANVDPELVARLCRHIRHADDADLFHMRSMELADEWELPRQELLRALLAATEVGIVQLIWNILCPLCRNPANSTGRMAAAQQRFHCDACNVDYDGDLSQNVEAVFRPTEQVRSLAHRDYCIAGPQTTPHIVAQQCVPGQGAVAVALSLRPGWYRVRGPHLKSVHRFHVSKSTKYQQLEISPAQDPGEPPEVCSDLSLELNNVEDDEQVFIVEAASWRDGAPSPRLLAGKSLSA